MQTLRTTLLIVLVVIVVLLFGNVGRGSVPMPGPTLALGPADFHSDEDIKAFSVEQLQQLSAAQILALGDQMSVLSVPHLDPDFIDRVLAASGSPAAGKGHTLYALGRKYGISSDLALAFYCHESSCGTAGEALKTRSWGNLRCVPVPAEADGCVDQQRGGYAYYNSYEHAMEGWYRLIKNLYVGEWNLTTLTAIVHKYAPSADGNDEAGYVRQVLMFLSNWYNGRVSS